MRNEMDARGAAGRHTPRKIPIRGAVQLSADAMAKNSADTDAAGYDPYDHVPPTPGTATVANRIVKIRASATVARLDQ